MGNWQTQITERPHRSLNFVIETLKTYQRNLHHSQAFNLEIELFC